VPYPHTRHSVGSLFGQRAALNPFSFPPRLALRSDVSDTWPPPGPQKPEPPLEHVRDLWVLHGLESNCSAGLYQTTFGVELRIHQNNELIESRLSRYGEEPLLLTAEQAKQNLLKLGWTELRLNATPASHDKH
jgi:hypothetical protein